MNNTIKAPKNKSSIAVRITVAITAAIAAVALVSVIIIYMLGLNALKHEIRDNLVMLSSNAAADIDADMLMSAAKKADETSVEYLTIQKQLQKIQKASGEKIRYIYTLVPSGGEMVYAVDAAPSDDTENHSVIGSFFDSKKYSAVLDGLKQATAELEPLEDTEFGGLIQTGYAPVKNLEGEVAGVLAIDMDVSIIKAKKREMNSAGAMTAAGALVVAVILGIAISSYITRPLRSITRTIEGLSMGDQDLMADQRRNDEIGELAKALNKMVFDLSLTREKLMSNNTELESKVVSRTLAISEINRDVRKMLDNISIAVFTVNEDMKVGTHYSGNAVDIFGEVFTSGTGLLDVLFPNAEVSGNHAYEKACMESWLIKAFESSISKWEFIETIQPVHETSFILLDDNGLENEKFIRIYFQPVQISTPSDPNEMISRMMVVIHDITGEKQLSSSVEKKDKKYPYDINIIIRKIKADTELFEDFINECREYLYGFEPLLTALRVNREDMELVNDLFRRVHTIKGNAKIFSLILIESKSYEIENVFSAVRK
ncbi:MAG: HAMP domain-containing protein, partial [Clostridiales bacterium]|nr:HAMP domain-containing protein [Clostridiales bacterium]